MELPIALYHFSIQNNDYYASNYGSEVAEMRAFPYPRMPQVAALPEAFATKYSQGGAHGFQPVLARFDLAVMGNDILFELVKVG